eukprot:scaffold5937_cov82-Skeletonema_marinoi.AAC.2
MTCKNSASPNPNDSTRPSELSNRTNMAASRASGDEDGIGRQNGVDISPTDSYVQIVRERVWFDQPTNYKPDNSVVASASNKLAVYIGFNA